MRLLQLHTKNYLQLALIGVVSGCASPQAASDTSNSKPKAQTAEESAKASYEIVAASEVKWEQLNPARGDKSPKAGTLWGDRKGTTPTGFLVEFVDGFSSPPHIHNVSYRGVVVHGLVHNDDPNAAHMWMPSGAFWTQPKGEPHITAAKGSKNVAYIEIEEGPYLVLPLEKAFDSGQRPINADPSNLVWQSASNTGWIKSQGAPGATLEAKIAFLWGSPDKGQLNGGFIKLSPRFVGTVHSSSQSFRAVVIQGSVEHQVPGAAPKVLDVGSYFSSKGKAKHRVRCDGKEACIIYSRVKGRFDVVAEGIRK